jgi:RNA polymerase sigma factor (sigma-70 family)
MTTEAPESSCEGAGRRSDAEEAASRAMDWLLHEVLPLEAILTQFLRHNWRDQSDIEDLLHDIYVRLYEAALKKIPDNAKAFVFATTRNFLINRVRDHNIVPIEAVADLEVLNAVIETPGADRDIAAREELRRLRDAIDQLPPHCREVVILRRIEGLSRGETAIRLGITPMTVSSYLTEAMNVLADLFYGETARMRRPR